jgi:hypothetical protein
VPRTYEDENQFASITFAVKKNLAIFTPPHYQKEQFIRLLFFKQSLFKAGFAGSIAAQ